MCDGHSEAYHCAQMEKVDKRNEFLERKVVRLHKVMTTWSHALIEVLDINDPDERKNVVLSAFTDAAKET